MKTVQAASFTVSDIEKMRKETLTLLRAAEKESSYDEALQVRDAIRKYQDHLEVLFYKKMAPSISDKSIEKEFRSKTWAFHIEMALPLWPDKHIDKDMQYRRWQEKKSKWLASVKRKARVAWSAVTDLFLRGSDQKEIEDTFSDTNEMEGFRIVFKDKPTHDNIPVIQASLKIARERLEKVFPKALVRKPTLIFERQGLDKGGQYEFYERGVVLNLDQWNKYIKNPQKCAQIIVHELAHDIEHSFLSDADLTYWRAAVRGDYGWLKLSEIIEKWPDDMATKSLYRLGEHLVTKDPILALKIQTLVLYRGVDYRSKEQAQEDLKKEDKVFGVPNSPISPYADTKPSEAFCEAFSLYTVYGPRAVLPVVRMWLRTILPSANIVASFKEHVKAKYTICAEPTLTLWHGGNLEFAQENISHKGGRWEHGPGLYLTTHYDTARKYAKGSRKLYQIVIRKGTNITEVNIPIAVVKEFIDTYFVRARKKDVAERIDKRVKDNKINADTFLNITFNEQAIKNTDTDKLREFLVKQGVDYSIVDNAFGWSERMIVLFNMRNIVSKRIVPAKEKIETFDLPTEWGRK